MSEVEIIVRAKDLAKATFESTDASVKVVRKSADELALSLRKAELAAQSAGASAESAMNRASAASEKAAASAQAAAEAQLNLARGVGSAEYAEKAEAAAERDATAATEAHTRAARAAERASIAQASAAKKAGEIQEAAAAKAEASSGALASSIERLSKVGKVALQGLVVGSVAIGVESIKAASKFDAAMTLINTQAGVSKDKIHGLSQGVLKLAADTAQSPDSLAEALFHVESNFASMGITSKKALDLTRIAAEGARVGQANLVDVTNALTAAVASGIPGVQNMNEAMGVLNATVGSGDMKMQDLADAFGTGMVAVVKGYGLSIRDVGAALAVFGDNNIRGAKAGTDLRMAVQALAVPVRGGDAELKKMGMTADQLAKDMRSGGLLKALEDLKQHMTAAGVTAKEQGQVITNIVGKKAGSGVNILIDQLDRLKSKYPDIERGAKGFGAAWEETQKTFSYQWDRMRQAVDAMMISLGEKLMPIVSKVMQFLGDHTGTLKVLAAVIGGVLLVAIGAYTASMAAAAAATIAATWPILAIIAAVAALVVGVVYAYNHFKVFRDFVHAMWEGIKVVWDQAKKHWEILVIAILGPLGVLIVYFKSHTAELKKMWAETWSAIQKRWKEFQSGPLKDIQHGLDDVRKFWKQNGAEITRDTEAVWRFLSMYIGSEIILAWNTVKVVVTLIVGWIKTGWGFTRDATRLIWQFIRDFITTVVKDIHNVVVLWTDLIHGHWSKVWGDIKNLVVTNLKGALKLIGDLLKNWDTLMFDAGKNIIKMLIDGIKSQVGALGNTLSGIANKIKGFFPFSPAKEGPLSGEGSPDKSGAKITSMLADGITSGTKQVADAASRAAAAASAPLHAESATSHHHSSHHRRHHAAPRLTINQQLANLAHREGHMSTHAVDKAVEKLMGQHRLTVAQLTKTMQILLAKGGHKTSTKQIDGLIAEMKKQYIGLSSKGILDAAIKELEHHPHMSTAQLMKQVAKDLHAKARKKKGSTSGSGSGSGDAGYIGDLSWTAGGVSYTVGGAGRATGPGGTAAGGTSGSTSVASGGSSGQHLSIAFATLKVEIDLKDTGGTFTAAELQGLRKMIRVRGGNVQKVLGS